MWKTRTSTRWLEREERSVGAVQVNRRRSMAASRAIFAVTTLGLAACGFDWSSYDPRLGTNGSGSFAGSGGGGGGNVGPGGGGNAGTAGSSPSCPEKLDECEGDCVD